jgi:HEAT repeat protein
MFAVQAAEALGKLGDPQAIPALIKALGDSDWDVRCAAAEALGKIGDPQAVPALIQALGDSE